MRTIYLIRHGKPDFPEGKRMCIGRRDIPISTLGSLESALAAAYLAERRPSAVFCSTLLRARSTAEILGGSVTPMEGLCELSAGEWDGVSFDEIRERWPELYKKRGEDPSLEPPGAEDRERGLRRVHLALESAVAVSTGDIAVVSHKTAIQLLLCEIENRSLDEARSIDLPYGSISTLTLRDGLYYAEETGFVPRPELTETVCLRLLAAADAPVELTGHSIAVAREAMRIVCALAAAGIYPDERTIFAAAMLHDIARRESVHPVAGAALLTELGYKNVADVVAQHHELAEPDVISEAAVVFLADKLVRGTERVGLERRFAESLEKCKTPEAVEAHGRRYTQAKRAASAVNAACGKDVIK